LLEPGRVRLRVDEVVALLAAMDGGDQVARCLARRALVALLAADVQPPGPVRDAGQADRRHRPAPSLVEAGEVHAVGPDAELRRLAGADGQAGVDVGGAAADDER